MFVYLFSNDFAFRVGTELKIMHRQTVMVVHDGDQMGRSHQRHAILLRIQSMNFFGMEFGDFF